MFNLPDRCRSMRYSKGSKNADRTFSTSGSPGNRSGSSCLNISTHEGTGATMSQPSSTRRASSGTFTSLAFATASRSPSSSFGIPQHRSRVAIVTGIPLCSNTRTMSSPTLGFVVVRIAGREQRHPAARVWSRHRLRVGRRPRLQPVSQRLRRVGRQPSVAVHAEHGLEPRPRRLRCIGGVDEGSDDRSGDDCPDSVGRTQGSVAEPRPLPTMSHSLGPQHQVRKVHIPLVCGGTYGHLVMKHMSQR